MTVEPTVSTIEYAPPLQWLRWHRWRRVRRFVYLFVALAVVAAGWRFGPRVWNQVVATYAMRACLGYQNPPPSTLVFDTVKRSATIPSAWSRLRDVASPGALPDDAIVFMHRMHTPSGTERLVVVSIVRTNILLVSVFDTGSWRTLPRRLCSIAHNGISVTEADHRSTQIFAGDVDPKDPSRFGFRADLATGEVMIFQGQLLDDDSVELHHQSLNPPSPFRLAPTRRAKPESL